MFNLGLLILTEICIFASVKPLVKLLHKWIYWSAYREAWKLVHDERERTRE